MTYLAPIDLATMPAFPADMAAVAALRRDEARRADQERRVREAMREHCGVTLPTTFNWRSSKEANGGYYLAVVHDFSSPMLAEARITILAHEFRWTRAKLMALSEWLAFDLGVRRLTAHIRAGDLALETLAQRTGFRLTGLQTHDEASRLVNVWSIGPEDLLLIGLRGAR